VSGVRAGSCAGFTNSKGINDSTITLANVADLSGPVPGLFTSAAQGAKAFVAYFNATSNVCGRKIKLTGYDSQTSSFGDQEAATSACNDTFAMVGSVGAFDNGGAKTVADCGIPDLRTISTTPERVASPVSFGADAVKADLVSTSQYEHLKASTGQAYQKSALVYINAGASVANALAYKATMQALGYDFVYTQPIDVTAINYAPYAAKMKSLGVSLVQFEGTAQFAVRLQRAMNDQGLHPVFVMDSVAYDPVFVETARNELDGMYTYVDTALVEEQARNPEMQRYLTWLARVAPGAKPSFFGIFAWGAMKLFSELAVQLGGRLTRQSLLAAIRDTHSFTADGLFAPQDVGTKNTSPCQAVVQLQHGAWVRRSPFPWTCSRVYDTQP
jgi:ABC-type branched-subunit amino acid transport system substrate-binding protein